MVSAVNALVRKLELTIRREGHQYKSRFTTLGFLRVRWRPTGDSEKTGTQVRFYPSTKIFTDTEFPTTIFGETSGEPLSPQFPLVSAFI